MGGFRRQNMLVFSLLIMVDVSCSMIIQGDILVNTGANTESDPNISSGVQLADASMIWPDGHIYYRFDDPGFQILENKKQVRDMMDYIKKKLNGCTTFHEVFNSDSDHVLITSRGCGGQPGNKCFAHVGRQGKKQCLNLDQTCMFNNTIVHELLHTMGFQHEHVRPDRDQFLTVITENIGDGAEHNFEKKKRGSARYFEAGEVETHNTPFDVMSVLLYPPSKSKQFSKDRNKPTLKYKVPIISSWPNNHPQEEPLTVIDTVEIAIAYNCPLEQQQMIDYININRISGLQTMERKMKTLETSLINLSKTNKVFQPALNPDIVMVSSDNGPASQEKYSKMGLYKRTEDFNNHPMWVNHDNTQKIFYSPDDHWKIGTDPESSLGGIRSVKTGLPVLPVTSWQYYGFVTWTDDAQLTVSAGQPLYPHSIHVSSEGSAAIKQPHCMGIYTKIEGQQKNGRPMWKHSDSTLFYSDNHYWTTGPDHTKTSGWIKSVKYGLVNLPETGWEYADSGWHQDDQLKFL